MQSGQQSNKPASYGRATAGQRVKAAAVFLVISGLFVFLRLAGTGKIDIGRWLTPCGFEQKYNLPCPTCGITTAAITFAMGRIADAFYIQPAGALLCCLLVVSGFLAFIMAVSGIYLVFLRRFLPKLR